MMNNIPSPCFVLEEQKLIQNLILLKKVQEQSGAKILCALKGFAMHSTFKLLNQYLESCAASSLNEARLCFEEFGKKAFTCAPAYIDSEFDELISYSEHITFNSIAQFEKYKNRCKSVSIGLRINPEHSEVATALYDPCATGSRMGITKANMPENLPKGVEGLHFHNLCEHNADALERTLGVITKHYDSLLKEAKWVNMGGGHHITREDYDLTLLIQLIKDFKSEYNIEVYLEPGEAIAWQTGFFKTTILDIVENGNIKTAVLDSSFTAHMPDCLEMPYQPEIEGSVANGGYNYRMGGMTCLAGDWMGDFSFDKPLEIGDEIIFKDMIHYTMVKTNTFNGINLPSIGILKQNGDFELVKSFGYEDYKGRLS